VGPQAPPNSGSFNITSDRASKKDLVPVDGEAVLSAIGRIPLWRWSYRTQADGIRHMGPTSQDFRAAFGLGEDDTTISIVDADGVNMAAVQALEKRTSRLLEENASLREELARVNDAQRLILQRLEEIEKK
jgi:hypothetical protein